MRVMLMVFPTRTHIYSMAPAGWALRAAGHEVRYVGQRNPTEVDSFLETGLDAQWLGDDLDIARHRRLAVEQGGPLDTRFKISESRPEMYTDEYVDTVYRTWAEGLRWTTPDSLLDETLRFARRWRPDLVLWDPLIYAGPLVAHVVGAAHARLLYAADQTARIGFQFRELAERTGRTAPQDDPLVAWMSSWLGRHGAEFDESLRYGMATIDPSPACVRYDLPVRYLPARFAPVNRPMTAADWTLRAPARPRVCLTLGVSNRQVLGKEETSVSDIFDAVDGLDVEVVATFNASQLEGVRAVPDNVRAVDFVPLNELLSTCSAIIHQGGGATIGNAVVNGVPQLIIPGTTWSERISAVAQEKRGNGLLLDLDQVTPGTVRAGLLRLLEEPSFRACALEVRDEMLATPTLRDLVPVLEDLAGGR